MSPEQDASPADQSILKPDESKEDFEVFYDKIGAAQIEERYYADFDYAMARYYLFTSMLEPWGRKGANLLDIGCASGYYSVAHAVAGGTVTGVDISAASVELSKRRAADAGVAERCTFLPGDMRDLPLEDASFDLVLMSEVLEHIREPDQALQQAATYLKPGGTLILATPHASDWSTIKERWENRNAPSLEAAGIEFERTGVNTRVTDAGIEHEPYFHDAFTYKQLEGLLPPEMEVKSLHSLWFNPKPGVITRYHKLMARLRKYRLAKPLPVRPEKSEADDDPGRPVEFPPPSDTSTLIVRLARAGWRIPIVRRLGLENFLIARRRP